MADADDQVYKRQGYGQHLGFGCRIALLVIDFANAFVDPAVFGGGNIATAVDHSVELLAVARAARVPTLFTTHAYEADGSDAGLFLQKNPRLALLAAGTPATAIVARLAPREGERLLVKRHPSAFFGTDVAGWLAMRGVDTLLVAGCTTSGCVRASVVDALGHGFRPVVVRECVGDRALGPHVANLFDMEQKYADVVQLAEVVRVVSAA